MNDLLRSIKNSNLFALKKEEFTNRIGLISIVVSLVIIVLIMSLFVLYTKQKRQRELISDGFSLSNMIAGYSVEGLERDEANKLLKIVNYEGSKSGLVYGMIMDINQQVIAHTDILYVDKILNDPIASRVASSHNPLKQVYKDPITNHEIVEFSRPIYRKGSKVSAVRLGFSQDILPLLSDSDIRGLFLIALLVFSLVPIFYYLMRKSMSSLVSLNDELQYMLETNEFREIQVNSSNGTGKLVGRFNKAISHIKDKHEKLSASYEGIEVANKILSYEKGKD